MQTTAVMTRVKNMVMALASKSEVGTKSPRIAANTAAQPVMMLDSLKPTPVRMASCASAETANSL